MIRRAIKTGLVTAFFASQAFAALSPVESESLGKSKELENYITNFSLVEEGRIFRGGRPIGDGVESLSKMKIKTIVNLQGGDINRSRWIYSKFVGWWNPGDLPPYLQKERDEAEKYNIRFFNFPFDSLKPIDSDGAKIIDDALETMNNPENHPLFIHCEYGIDRTGLLIALYRVKYNHWTPEEASKEMILRGFSSLHKYFNQSVDDYFWKVAPSFGTASKD